MIWTIAYWVLLVLGILIGLRALFWDRAGFRGRAKFRCRKCWYDLTASPGDLREEPIRCPECGKKHASRRAMRKTRRSKRWIAVALVLWVGAYGAKVTPRIQKSGWGAAVPRVVIVASLPFLSEEPGTGIYNAMGFGDGGVPPSRWDSFVMKQAGDGLQFYWGMPGEDVQFGWLSRRLAYIIAQFESESVMTNVTTAKGNAYRSIFSQIEHAGKFYPFESRWANSVNYVEIEIGEDVAPDSVIYGDFYMRRLLAGSYGLRFGWRGDVFRCDTSSGMWITGMHPTFPTQKEKDAYWIQRFLWDSRTRIDANGKIMHWSDDRRVAIGVSSPAGPGSAATEVSVRYTIYEIEQRRNTNSVELGDQLAQSEAMGSFTVDQDAAIIEDSSAELEEFILNHMKAELIVKYDHQREQWVPIVKLRASTSDFAHKQTPALTAEQVNAMRDGGKIPDILFERSYEIPELLDRGVIFGGRISLEIVWDLGDGNPYTPALMWGGETVWRWGTVEYPEKMGMPPARDNREPRVMLLGRSLSKGMIPGEIQPKGNTPARYGNHKYTLRAHFQPFTNSTWKDYGGLWGKRVYLGELNFPISEWTTDELRALIVNGTVPDHAMP